MSRADSVLEVGAGIGTLTRGLAERAGWVTAVEVDPRLLRALDAVLARTPNVRIVPGDILDLAAADLFDGPAGAARKVVANLPYNIASAVLMRFLGPPLGLALLVVTVQREVAERITARPGGRTYGILSVAVQYRAVPRIVARIPPGAFFPQPAVESALVELRPLARPAVEVPDEPTFFKIVSAGFAQRRKTLHNALVSVLDQPRDVVARALSEAGIESRARAETLDLAAFGRLALALAGPLRDAATSPHRGGRGRG